MKLVFDKKGFVNGIKVLSQPSLGHMTNEIIEINANGKQKELTLM